MKNITQKDIKFIIGLAGCWLIFYSPLIFTNKIYNVADINQYFYPVKNFATESLQQGLFPFWDPYISCGIPFFATLQHGLLYPASLLPSLFPFLIGFKWLFLLHFIWAAIFIYLLLRSLSFTGYGSFIGAITFTFSGYLVSSVSYLTTLSAVIWLSLAVLLFQKALINKSYLWTVLLGITLGLQFLSGQPEIVYITGLILVSYAVYQFITTARPGKLFILKRAWVVLLSSFALMSLLVAVQLLPFLELIKLSHRSETVSFSQITSWSLHPLELLSFIVPAASWNFAETGNWFKQYWLKLPYIGIITILLIFLSWQKGKARKIALYFLLLLGLGLALSLGKYSFLYKLFFTYLPGLNSIRYPVKFTLMIFFSLSALAAAGADHLVTCLNNKNILAKLIKALAAVLLISLHIAFIAYVFRQNIFQWLTTNFLSDVLVNAKDIFYYSYFPACVKEFLFELGFLGLLIFLLILTRQSKIKVRQFKILFTGLVFGGLAFVLITALPKISLSELAQKGELTRLWEQCLSYERISLTPKTYSLVTRQTRSAEAEKIESDLTLLLKKDLLPNRGIPFHIYSAHGYESINLSYYIDYLRFMGLQKSPSSTRLIDLLDVKYLVSFWPLSDPNWVLFKTYSNADSNLYVYENKRSLAKVLLVHQAITGLSPAGTLSRMADPYFNPEEEIFIANTVADPAKYAITTKRNQGEKTSLIEYTPNRIAVRANLNSAGWLLLNDSYYPGWRVYIDNQPGTIFKANYLFRGVPLKAGNHLVIFTYCSNSFKWGLILSIATIMGLFVASTFLITPPK